MDVGDCWLASVAQELPVWCLYLRKCESQRGSWESKGTQAVAAPVTFLSLYTTIRPMLCRWLDEETSLFMQQCVFVDCNISLDDCSQELSCDVKYKLSTLLSAATTSAVSRMMWVSWLTFKLHKLLFHLLVYLTSKSNMEMKLNDNM